MTRKDFEQLVTQALDGLPENFARALDNVNVEVETWPTRADLTELKVRGWLFGLYRGIPQTKRGNYNAALPDKIIIFAGPILAVYGSDPLAVKQQVRETVLHEIGHHFGMSEEQIRKAMDQPA